MANRWAWLVSSCVLAAASTWVADSLVSRQVLVNDLDAKADHWLTALGFPVRLSSEVVIVEIHDSTIPALGLGQSSRFVPRSVWADLIQLLDNAGASVLVFDIALIDPTADDAKMVSAIQNSKSLATVLLTLETEALQKPSLTEPDGLIHTYRPIPMSNELDSTKARVGCATAFDPGGTIAGFIPFYQDSTTGERIYQTALLAALAARNLQPDDCNLDPLKELLTCGSLQWAIGESHEIRIPWSPNMDEYQMITVEDAMQNLRQGDSSWAKGKVILVCDTRHREDLANLPEIGLRRGPYVVADTIHGLLLPQRGQTRFVQVDSLRVIGGVACLLAGMLVWWLRPLKWISAFALLVVGSVVIPWVLAKQFGVIFVPVSLILSLLITGAAMGSFIAVRGWPQPHHTMTSHLICILFVDLRGSTPLLLKIGRDRFQELKKLVHELKSPHRNQPQRTFGAVHR